MSLGRRLAIATARIPDSLWSVIMASILILIVGATAVAASQPWLFPSLGPTAYLRARHPESPLVRPYNSIVGHLIGLASGFAAVAIFNAWHAPVVPLNDVTWSRVWAGVLAIGLTVAVCSLLKASHPPAAATTLLIALGTFRTAWQALLVIVGVVMLVVIGEGLGRLVDYLRKRPDEHRR